MIIINILVIAAVISLGYMLLKKKKKVASDFTGNTGSKGSGYGHGNTGSKGSSYGDGNIEDHIDGSDLIHLYGSGSGSGSKGSKGSKGSGLGSKGDGSGFGSGFGSGSGKGDGIEELMKLKRRS
tara:strand:- start:625 stop:996 length:372 start_codon:yes stop_codon:yes gene_type:complete